MLTTIYYTGFRDNLLQYLHFKIEIIRHKGNIYPIYVLSLLISLIFSIYPLAFPPFL